MIKKILLYSAVYLGCLFEGETSLITSAFAAHRGYLEIIIVMILALAATQTWDWIWFTVGRTHGKEFIAKKPRLHQKVTKIHRILEKRPVPFLLGYRFMFGFRTAGPLVIGMSTISKKKFLTFSLTNTLIWDIATSSLGYFFGAFLKANLRKIEDYEFEIMACLLVTGVITGLCLRYLSVKNITRQSNLMPANNDL
jgi:membrane protein DedA with SNARE-associated domain